MSVCNSQEQINCELCAKMSPVAARQKIHARMFFPECHKKTARLSGPRSENAPEKEAGLEGEL